MAREERPLQENHGWVWLNDNILHSAGRALPSMMVSRQLQEKKGVFVHTAHLQSITRYLDEKSDVKFAYLFGSCAGHKDGPLSDIDLAVYLDKRLDFFVARLRFMDELSQLLKGHPCDFVVLNTASLILQYEVIRGGRVVKEDKKKRIPFEIGVVREYLDTEPIRAVHIKKLKESFLKGQSLG